MDIDYDIYSYLAYELCNGNLELKLASEKVTYEIVDIDLIDLNIDNNPIIRYKLNIIGENGKRLLNEDGKIINIYENMESLNNNYIKISNKKNILRKKNNDNYLIQIPKTIKLPTDKGTSKLSIFEAGKWIDITDLDNLKMYSDKRCIEMFEFKNNKNNSLKKVI